MLCLPCVQPPLGRIGVPGLKKPTTEYPLEGLRITRSKMWRSIVAGGTLLAAVALHADGAAGQNAEPVQTTSPTYAIPLRDGGTAIVWWDAVSDPANPGWRCEVSALRGGGASRTITALAAAAGDWRAALEEARTVLKGRVADGE